MVLKRREFLTTTGAVALGLAAPVIGQNYGEPAVIEGRLIGKDLRTRAPKFYIRGYRIYGMPSKKLKPYVNQWVKVHGEFRILLRTMVFYANKIERAKGPREKK